MKLPLYQVDAFTGTVFRGNPAAVCPLEAWLPDAVMQAIAAENNLSETAFFVPDDRAGPGGFALRWFTPVTEVDLCGHATLASAFVVMTLLQPGRSRVEFATRVSGTLSVERQAGPQGDLFVMDFPRWPAEPLDPPPPELARALGRAPRQVFAGPDWMAVFDDAAEVAALQPDFAALRALPARGIIATAPGATAAGHTVDFVSRFFAPAAGIDEDPVTGSAHCMLTPYWAERLGRTELSARQISRRGGELRCTLAGDRVQIGGQAVLYLSGTIAV